MASSLSASNSIQAASRVNAPARAALAFALAVDACRRLGRAAAAATSAAGAERCTCSRISVSAAARPSGRRASPSGAAERGESADALSVRDLRRVHRPAFRRQPAGRAARRRGPRRRRRCSRSPPSSTTRRRPSCCRRPIPPIWPRVRIFTPRSEMPFAGHPDGRHGARPGLAGPGAGRWRVRARGAGRAGAGAPAGRAGRCRVRRVRRPAAPSAWRAAARSGRSRRRSGSAEPTSCPTAGCLASPAAGAPFLLVELASLAAAGRGPRLDARADLPRWRRAGCFLFTRETGDAAVDLRARMFAPAARRRRGPRDGQCGGGIGRAIWPVGPGLADGWHALAHRAGDRDGPAEPDRGTRAPQPGHGGRSPDRRAARSPSPRVRSRWMRERWPSASPGHLHPRRRGARCARDPADRAGCGRLRPGLRLPRRRAWPQRAGDRADEHAGLRRRLAVPGAGALAAIRCRSPAWSWACW